MRTPKKCLMCGSQWKGGATAPGKPMKEGLRVFYDCGWTVSYKIIENINGRIVHQLISHSCRNEEK